MKTRTTRKLTHISKQILDEYTRRTKRSASLHRKLRRVLPGGETRSVSFFHPYPIVIESGNGAWIRDVDGNSFIDVLNNYTSLVHGHRFPPVEEAIVAALRRGTAYPAPHEGQLLLGEEIVRRYPAVELVRFTNSGTEASLLALRIARRWTGREIFILFEGGFHGTVPDFMEPSQHVRRLPYNDFNSLNSLDDSVAGIFVEPFLGTGGVIPADPGFLLRIQGVAKQVGALFILDEVQSLRCSFRGLHGSIGLAPDLVAMGKIIGGGLPVGALGGRAEVMEMTAADRADSLSHSGTFNGNVISTAAGLSSLRHLDVSAIDRLNLLSAQLTQRIEEIGERLSIPLAVTRVGSIMQVHFADRAPTNPVDEASVPQVVLAALHLSLLLEGVYAAPRGTLNLSTVLTDAEVDLIAIAYERALARVSALVEANVGT